MKNENLPYPVSLRKKAEAELKKKHTTKAPTSGSRASNKNLTSRTEIIRNERSRSKANQIKLLHELEVHQIELEIQNSELRLALDRAETAISLYDFAPAGYFTLTRDGMIAELNLAGAKLLGKDRYGLINSNFEQLITKDALPDFNIFLGKVFESCTRNTCNVRLYNQGKPSIYVHLEGIISDDMLKCIVTAVDITDLKQIEEALRESENRLNQVIECSYVWIWEVDKDGLYTYVSSMEENVLGYDPEELIGKKYFYDFFHPDIKDELIKAALDIFSKKGSFSNFENPNIHKNGQIVILETSGIPLLDKHGSLLGYRGADRDITDRKKAEEQLRESKERFHSLFENATIGLYRTSLDGRILMANPTAIRLVGYNSFEELAQRNLENEGFESVISRSQFRQRIEQDGVVRGIESAWTRHDGTVVFIRESATAFRNAEGITLYYEGTIEDITERKLAEEALKESEVRLRELNATKDKFFSIIAHDLRNPFNSIIGFSNLLSRHVQQNDYDGIEKYARIISLSSERAMSLIANLLEWARSQIGSLEFKPENIEVSALINEITDLLNDSAQQKSITITRKLPGNVVILADKYMISSVLRNMISNAVKFTNPGGKIVISAKQKKKEFMVTVSDDGVGIKPHNIHKLFRIDESYATIGTQNEKGTGLGLILCKEFVEKHGGTIWAESEFGKGSKFCFTIPK